MKNIILKASLFISVAILFSGCLEYEDVDFKGIQNFKLEEKTSENLVMRLDLKVDNPNKYNITIAPSDLDIYVNGKLAGKTKMREKVVLKKETTGVYPLYMKAKTKDIMSALPMSLGSLLSGKIKLGIKGKVKAKAYGVGKKFAIDEEETVYLKNFM